MDDLAQTVFNIGAQHMRDVASKPRQEVFELPDLHLGMIKDGLKEICRAQGFSWIKFEHSSGKFFGVRYVEDQPDGFELPIG